MADIEIALNREFERTVRLGRPLSVLVLVRRDMPLGLPGALLEQASIAISNATRTYDNAGLVGDRVIIVILPETDAAGAGVVSDRLRIELGNRNNGHCAWTVRELTHAEQYGAAGRVIQAALRLASEAHAA